MNRIQLRYLDQHRRHSRRAARHELQIAQRRKKRTASSRIVLHPLPGSKPSAPKRLCQLVERVARSHRRDQRHSLDHVFDCIVWNGRMNPRPRGPRSPMNYETLSVDIQDAIATVTLNRPEVLHALNAQMFNDLESVFQALGYDAAFASFY